MPPFNLIHVYTFQVTGTLLIYALFMVELFRSDPIESLDEVIYWVNAISRVLEFVVALCVVAYGTWESLFGEWSWMGASVIIIHSYFNVWLRGQSGWKSFLLRQEAAKKINSLPRATPQQLQQYNDVCSICFQVSHTLGFMLLWFKSTLYLVPRSTLLHSWGICLNLLYTLVL